MLNPQNNEVMCFSPDLSVSKQNSPVNMKVRTVRQVKQQRPRNRRFAGILTSSGVD